MTIDNPTQRTYDSLHQAYAHFNTVLFGGQLPPCLITMQRRQGAYGFFAAERFANPASPTEAVDEIALNPALFRGRRTAAVLSTLAQEMVQVWQHHRGQRSRPHYYNRQWALKMREVGLIPTDTGQPGGKETGQRMSYYIEKGGAFEHACRAFLAESDVVLYHDREKTEETDKTKSPRKTQYRCPNCRMNAWAKPDVSLRCGACDRAMTVAPGKRKPAALVGEPALST